MTCPLCGGAGGRPWLRRPGVPVHQNRIAPTREAARSCRRGDLTLALCDLCGFIWNAAFDAALVEYDGEYDNSQAWSGAFRTYTDALARDLVRRCGLAGKAALEVGCGKGDFLVQLVLAGAGGGLGLDTSYVGPAERGRVRFERRRYRRGDQAALVLSRHVIEHVPAPMQFLAELREALGDATGTAVFLETPTISWILERGVFWDLFYEHCSYFDTRTLAWAAEAAGLAVESVEEAFGGQYQHLLARPATPRRLDPAANGRAARASVERYLRRASATEAAVRALLDEHGPGEVAVWGAGAKGATLLHLVDPDATRVRWVVDISPGKQGRFVPGTGHAIVPPEMVAQDPPRAILLMNVNYQDENRATLRRLGAEVPLVALDLLEPALVVEGDAGEAAHRL